VGNGSGRYDVDHIVESGLFGSLAKHLLKKTVLIGSSQTVKSAKCFKKLGGVRRRSTAFGPGKKGPDV
jgi:hypothetical protein